jgi:chromate reductase
MSEPVRLLAFAGSLRSGSLNKKLLRVAVEMAQAQGAQVTVLDLRELTLPIYDGDLEASSGLPEGARRLKDLMRAHDGFLIASPEYNSGVSGALKNAIDWASRPEQGNPPSPFANKTCGLLSASPGSLGGLRGLTTLRISLENLNVFVIPLQGATPRAHEAFGEDGRLKDPKQHTLIESVITQLVRTTAKLKA